LKIQHKDNAAKAPQNILRLLKMTFKKQEAYVNSIILQAFHAWQDYDLFLERIY
jgi:hypothetical protein